MKVKTYFTVLFLFVIYQNSQSQIIDSNLKINFKIKFNQEDLTTNKKYLTEKKDTITITNFKCYLSNFEIQFDDHSIQKEENSVHLLDLKKPKSLNISLPRDSKKNISRIRFNIGIDSLSSVSGAMEGDLDPMNGMYWSWQSGYINMKLEGKSSSCNTPKKEFQFHIGGYDSPNYAMRQVTLDNKKNNPEINIIIDLATLFATLSLKENNMVMSPGKEAMKIADTSIQLFSVE